VSLIPLASVEEAPGTSIVVKVPPDNKYPWNPVASWKAPTIWPGPLMPRALVKEAPGTSIVVKLPPDNR
jgi:hypothetical protein